MQQALFAQTPQLDYLQAHLLPSVLEQAHGQRQALRIWSFGCQAGDEAAALARALQAVLGEQMAAWQIRIFATDLDPLTLARARQRLYPPPPPADRWWQERFAAGEGSSQGSRLPKALRDTIIFAPHDLLSQPPFPHLDLIVCHPPLADWEPDAQSLVLNRFASTLAARHYLWLVAPGTTSPDAELWECADASLQLYRRTSRAVPWQSLRGKRTLAGSTSVPSGDQQIDLYPEELQTLLEEQEVTAEELEERLQELEAANQHLAQLNRVKEDFLSMASHELGTPLTSLFGYAELLQLHLSQEGNQQAVQFVSRMQTQLEKLARLVSDLLDTAKMQAGHLVYRQERVRLDELVREVVETAQLTALRHRILLEIEAEGPAEVTGDQDRLGQVVLNLLSNAIKYSPQADQVRVRLVGTPGQMVVSVRDFGIGLSTDSQARVFEQFYRAPGTAEHRFSGLGLGLYLAHQIIAHHEGRMWVESAPGHGSTFSFALPLASQRHIL